MPVPPTDDRRIAESEALYHGLLGAMDVGFCIIEMLFDERGIPCDYRFLEANPAFERHTGLSDILGKTVREFVPDHDAVWFQTYGAVALTGEPIRLEDHAVAMNRWFEVYAQRVGAAEERRVGVFFTDITARKQAEEALHQSEQRLREQGEYLRRLLESSPDCIKTMDLDGRIVAMTEGGQAAMQVDDFAAICNVDWLTFWQDEETKKAVRAAIGTARTGGTGRFQGYCPTMKGAPRWWDVIVAPILGANGLPEQLLGISRDITEQKRAEARARSRLTDIFMRAPAFMTALRGPQHIHEMANPLYLQLIGRQDILGKTVAEVIPEMVEQGFVGLLDHVYQTGDVFTGKDTSVVFEVDADGLPDEHFVDFTFQPLFDEDGAVSGILVHGIDLTYRKRLERERERLLEEQRARAEREALLNRIGAAVRSTLEPDGILKAAIAALGPGLGADRCYFVRYNQTRDQGFISAEWFREGSGLEPIAGRPRQMSAYSVNRDPDFRQGLSQVVVDTEAYAPEAAAPLLALGVRSLVRVPMEVGEQMTALGVAMAHEPRDWSAEDVLLVENAATLIRSALESAHVQQRERNIAVQLQEALQPVAPNSLPGLKLAAYYRPALAEATVGGDFYDVFPIDEGCTALVVADLSGKGLAAASQVATVRNMLRYALYSAPTLAEAVTGLHRALVKHDLLVGFATLFLGIYDEKNATLTYVNCGQEPGLIWRSATGVVDQMPPTGPVLGGFGSGDFEEEIVALSPGDVLALFTDGLTEVGPSRKIQLDVEGVSEVLRNCCAQMSSEAQHPWSVVECLISGVDDFARGGVRDDIALLVGVVGG